MATWRYVVSRSRDEDNGELAWEIRELYPSEDGTFSYTADAVSPIGESLDELLCDLDHMRSDADLDILDLTVDPPRLIPRSDLTEQAP